MLSALTLTLALLAQDDGLPPATLPTTDGMDAEIVSHIEKLVAAVAAEPADGDAHADLGLAYEANTCFEPAAQCYRHAIALMPGNPEWRYRLGKILLDIGDVEEALIELEAAADALTNTPVIQAYLGHAYLQLGDLDGAEAAWQAAIDGEAKQPSNPVFPQSRVGMASVRFEQGRFPEAVTLCEEALKVYPTYRHAHYLLGLALFEVGEDLRAEYELTQGMKAWPEFPPDPHGPRLAGHAKGYQRRMMIAENMMMAGQLQEAIGVVDGVLAKSAADAMALTLRARCQQGLGQGGPAIETFRKAEEVDPKNVNTKIFLAIALINHSGSIADAEARTAMLTEALETAREAVALAPRQGRAHFFLGFALLANLDTASAFGEMNIALRLGCDEPQIYTQLTQMAASIGRMSEMVTFAEKNVRNHPVDPNALRLLIQAYLTDNRLDEAESVNAKLESLGIPQMAGFVNQVKQHIEANRAPEQIDSGPPLADDDGETNKQPQ